MDAAAAVRGAVTAVRGAAAAIRSAVATRRRRRIDEAGRRAAGLVTSWTGRPVNRPGRPGRGAA
ncbi:hypothetical protein FLX07_06885 [Microbispora bryophytorum]|nr:hypothetical protein FLX07_06885 [Microbispora bryophytorum]